MVIYFVILFLFGSLILIKSYSNDTQNLNTTDYKVSNILLISITFLILFFIYFFRSWSVGTDYSMYNNFYYLSDDYLKSIGIEPGFLFLYSLARHVENFRIISCFSFLIFWWGLIRCAKQLKIDQIAVISFFVVSYTYFISFNIIRQMTAIGIVMLGLGNIIKNIEYFKRKKISKLHLLVSFLYYLIFVAIAQLFHSSAWVAVFLPFVMLFKVTSLSTVFGGAFTVVAYLSRVANILFPHLLFLFSHYVEKYSSSGLSFFTEGEKSVTALLPVIIQFIFLYIIVSHEKDFSKNNQALISGYYMYLVLFSGGGNVPILRVQAYWLIFITFFYAKYFTYHASLSYFKDRNLFKFFVFCFWMFYAILRIVLNISGVVPYVFQY